MTWHYWSWRWILQLLHQLLQQLLQRRPSPRSSHRGLKPVPKWCTWRKLSRPARSPSSLRNRATWMWCSCLLFLSSNPHVLSYLFLFFPVLSWSVLHFIRPVVDSPCFLFPLRYLVFSIPVAIFIVPDWGYSWLWHKVVVPVRQLM